MHKRKESSRVRLTAAQPALLLSMARVTNRIAVRLVEPRSAPVARMQVVYLGSLPGTPRVGIPAPVQVPYQDLLSGKTDAATLLDNVKAFEKLGVTEGTLA